MPELSVLLIAAFITVLAGLFRGFAGFGSGLLMAPVLTLVLEPIIAIPVILMLSLAGSARLLPEAWPLVRWRRVFALVIPAAIMIPLGARLLQIVDAVIVQKSISVLVLILVIVLASGWKYPGRVTLKVSIPTGMISGVLTGIGGVGGPPVVLLSVADSAPPKEIRANLIAFFTISQVVGTATYLLSGMLSGQVATMGLILAPLFIAMIHIGSVVFRKIGEGSYRKVALAFLACIALFGLLW